jgi:uncharacterized protein (UPF0548 family)
VGFSLARPAEERVGRLIAAARSLAAPAAPEWISIDAARRSKLAIPRGFVRDVSDGLLGNGERVFEAAKLAFRRWAQFDLGWTRVANPEARVELGAVVAVEVRSLGLWSLNLSRIVAKVDSPGCFGFVYATTEKHVEEGEELFLLRLEEGLGEVRYHVEAVSRPRQMLARIGYPITRHFQHRFARESHGRMREVVRANDLPAAQA